LHRLLRRVAFSLVCVQTRRQAEFGQEETRRLVSTIFLFRFKNSPTYQERSPCQNGNNSSFNERSPNWTLIIVYYAVAAHNKSTRQENTNQYKVNVPN